jgi:hypothetical protein
MLGNYNSKEKCSTEMLLGYSYWRYKNICHNQDDVEHQIMEILKIHMW